MILKTLLTFFYFLVLYNFTFIEVGSVYNLNFSDPRFWIFIEYFLFALLGLSFVQLYIFKDAIINKELKYTFSSVIFIYIFIIWGFFLSQEYLIYSFESGKRMGLSEAQLSWNLAFLFLSLSLLISPILYFIKNITLKLHLILFRKIFGILVAIIFLRHFIDFFQSHYPYVEGFIDYTNYFFSTMMSPVIWTGTLAWIWIIFLWLSSNKVSIKLLWWKLWKALHTLVFPIYLFSMLHVWYLGRIDWFYGGITLILIVARISAFLSKRYKKLPS